jgi:hypothetical protein
MRGAVYVLAESSGERIGLVEAGEGAGDGTHQGQTEKVPEKTGIHKGMRISCTSTELQSD